MAKFASLPLFIDSYLADTRHLSDAEHGRYLQLLFLLWRSPKCRVPNEDAWLARKFARPTEKVMEELRPIIIEFCQIDGNWITQKRLSKEWEYTKVKVGKKSAAAKARWAKEKKSRDAYAERNVLHDACNAPTPTPTPTPTIEEEKKEVAPQAALPPKGRRWGSDEKVPEEWIREGEMRRIEHRLVPINLDLEAEAFANYWSSKAGKDATKVDWRKTWLNRALKAEGMRNGQRISAHDKGTLGAAEWLASREDHGSADGDGVGTAGGDPSILPPRHGQGKVATSVPKLLGGPKTLKLDGDARRVPEVSAESKK